MAATIIERPIGVILGDAITATINEDYSGVATINHTSHGLSDNDWVYISSNVENYNGFWQIEVTGADEFLLKNPEGGYVPYVVNADITYYPGESTHGWSCVHLPITYTISNNRFPVNTVDTERTIDTLANNNGYAQLGLSGSLGTFEDLSFVKISNAPDSDLDGVYQILDKLSTTSIVLNLAFSSVTNATLLGATIQLYYGNYSIDVRVYAGINASHEWASVKPYELAATLNIKPDSDNLVKFSVHEILKAYITTENNLLLGMLPNNTDFWTNFYISVQESYDESNGYTVGRTESGYANDSFEGTAVNAMLAFKNVHSGYLTEYLMTRSTAKFLTLFTIPVLFSCDNDDCYNEITAINPNYNSTSFTLKQEYYSNDVLQSTVNTEYANAGIGVYRFPISNPDCSYDRVEITLLSDFESSFDNSDFGQIDNSGEEWETGSTANLGSCLLSDIDNTIKFTDIVYVPFNAPPGSYVVGGSQHIDVIGGTPDAVVRFYLLDINLNILDTSSDYPLTNDATENNSELLTSTSHVHYIGAMFEQTANAAAFVEIILTATGTDVVISETKSTLIDCGCADQEIRLSWLNHLGGFDYWNFTAQSEFAIDITENQTSKKNTFPTWPKSYGEFSDTIRRETYRKSANRQFVTSQLLTQEQADAIAWIKSSPLVQIVNSRKDRRTVLVDTDSFVKYKDGDKTYTISFNITFTDDLPSQMV
jgi:hypothetical protein